MLRRRLGGWLRGGTSSSPRSMSLFPSRSCHFCLNESIVVPPYNDDSDGAHDRAAHSAVTDGNGSTAVSVGTVSNWFCSQCRCWNRTDPTQEGGLASWEREMNSGSAPENALRQFATPANSKQVHSIKSAESIPFCHACQTNQMLLVSMIANYGDEEGDEASAGHAFATWKASIEERYPPVCEDCLAAVEERLQKADQRARALIWNDLLRRRAVEKEVEKRRIQPPKEKQVRETPTRVPMSWYLHTCLLLTSFLASILVAASPKSFYFPASAWACISVSFPLFSYACHHDMSTARRVWLQRERGVRIAGQESAGGRALFLISILSLANVVVSWMKDTQMLERLTFFLCVVQALVFVRSSWQVGYRRPRYIVSLRSRNVSQTFTPTRRSAAAPDLAHLSLGGQSHSIIDHGITSITDDDSMRQDDSMDWSPTLPATDDARTSVIGPQRFFEPLKQTGLEDLLDHQLELSQRGADSVDEDVAMTSVTAVPVIQNQHATRTLLLLVLSSVAAFTAIVACSAFYLDLRPALLIHQSIFAPFRNWWQNALSAVNEQGGDKSFWSAG